jgi:Lipase (class 3)
MKWQLILLGGIVVTILIAYWRVRSRPAYRQTPSQVVFRDPGRRRLGSPQPVGPQAKNDLEYAWLSQAAYQHISDGLENDPAGCPGAVASLQNLGWLSWQNFPDAQLLEQMAVSHLRVDVWVNPARKSVNVAFGGTVFKSGKDWKSNLRWFIPFHNDEYTELVKKFGPAFVNEFAKRKEEPQWAFLRDAEIYATGHSLGGGLAQQFAYALPRHPAVPRVTKVFAFDPSPVTGYYSLPVATRRYNSQFLFIDRIYERGEILAYLRSIESFVYPPSAQAPVIRQVRYDLFPTHNPIAGHSIADLACKLYNRSH